MGWGGVEGEGGDRECWFETTMAWLICPLWPYSTTRRVFDDDDDDDDVVMTFLLHHYSIIVFGGGGGLVFPHF